MTTLPLGRSAFERTRGSLPRLPVVNFIMEAAPTEESGVIFQSRKGLMKSVSYGAGPIHQTHQLDGSLNGVRITVSGGAVYAGSRQIGFVEVKGPVSIAADATEVLIAAGGPMVRWDGTTFSTVSFPDGADVLAVRNLAGYFIAIRANTQRVYFSAVGDGSSWDGLDYFAAESEPDFLRDALIVSDGLVLIGTRTTEFWVKTGNADLPFQAIQQRLFEYGAIATGVAVAGDNTHFWIGDDGIVYRAGNVPEPISDDGHTADILSSTTWRAYMALDERHKLLFIRLDAKTLVFDITSKGWSEFACSGRANFRGYCADRTIIGDDMTGTLWVFSGYFDNGEPMERRVGGGFPINGGTVGIENVRIRAEVGQASALSGEYANPIIEMRFSDDLGKTWGEWEGESLGVQGDYRTMPEWRALGMFDYPGALFEFRVTDPVSVRLSGGYVNESTGGRAR